MDKYQLLEYLEGRYISITFYSNVGGELFTRYEWHKVEFNSVHAQFGIINLNLHGIEWLENWAKESISQAQYEQWYVDQQKEYQRIAG